VLRGQETRDVCKRVLSCCIGVLAEALL
jgi:hypothetical protein